MLIGHSYGCYLVNRLASTEEVREKVSVVVLIGAGYPVAGYNHLRWIFYLPTFVSCLHSCHPSSYVISQHTVPHGQLVHEHSC